MPFYAVGLCFGSRMLVLRFLLLLFPCLLLSALLLSLGLLLRVFLLLPLSLNLVLFFLSFSLLRPDPLVSML